MMRRLSLLLAVVLLAACPEPVVEPDDPTPQRQSCTPGLSFCDENVVKICGDDGRVVDRVACETTQTCVLGECQNNRICEPDAFVCVANELQQCNSDGTAIIATIDCGGQICVAGACQPVAGTCPPLAFVCVDNSAAVCNAAGDGYAVGPAPCGNQALCMDGVCNDLLCDAGEAECVGILARTCDAWGTGYSVEESCIGGEACVRGRCQPLVCTPGTSCRDGRVVTCSDDGTAIIDDRACRDGTACVDGRCVESAVDAGPVDRRSADGRLPDLRQTDLRQPDTRLPDGALPDGRRPDAVQADGRRPDGFIPDGSRPDGAGPDNFLPDTRLPDIVAPDRTPPTCDPPDDVYEPNDERAQAKTVSNSVVLELIACDDEDWFRTTVPVDRALRLDLTFTHADCDLDLYIYERGETSYYVRSYSSTDNEMLRYDRLQGASGDVEIRIDNVSYPSKQCSYTFTLALIDPPVCGDGERWGSELCDTNIAQGETGACPTSCSDSYCTRRSLAEAGTCQARCVASSITTCVNGDQCCPEICTALTDDYCPAGYTPCGTDNDCPSDRYCDLQRAAPVCKVGCRIGVASTCADTHRCALDHRCVLANVVPHQRCADCSDSDPCADGYECIPLFGVCAAACSIFWDDCNTQIGPNEMCLLTFCSQSDCP